MDRQHEFRHKGYVSPLRGLSPVECSFITESIRDFGKQHQIDERIVLRNKAHLLMLELQTIISNSLILDAVEEIIGPNILCWSSSLFIKETCTDATVGWHQDAWYWNLQPNDVCVVWLALTHSTSTNGALSLIPGSHKKPLMEHGPSANESTNMLYSREEISEQIDPSRVRHCELQNGEFSMHDQRIVHGSGPNLDDRRRVGFSITYLAPHVQHIGLRKYATVVRGIDEHNQFISDPTPDHDMSEEAVSFLRRVFGMFKQDQKKV